MNVPQPALKESQRVGLCAVSVQRITEICIYILVEGVHIDSNDHPGSQTCVVCSVQLKAPELNVRAV